MNTKLIMTITALLFAAIGISLSFASDNIIAWLGISPNNGLQLTLQLLGALYFAFAMLNWMAKGAILGGIYNRPIVVANFAHFLIAGMALTKATFGHNNLPTTIGVMAGFYMVCAVTFGILMSKHPGPKSTE